MAEIKYNIHYPYSDQYYYETYLEKISLDTERINDILSDNGFVVTSHKSIKKDIKDPRGIFSQAFGQGLQDVSPYADRHKCTCGHLSSRLYYGIKCPVCGQICKYVDDNFKYFGWITLKDPYYIIHPNIYKFISSFIGNKRFLRIITEIDEKDEDGHSIEIKDRPKDEPFLGIGMIKFNEHFDEIMEFYKKITYNKNETYDEIMNNRDKVFTQSIPVFTIHLRPFRLEGNSLFYEDTNKLYTIMTKLAAQINKDNLKIFRALKPKSQLLFDLQMKYNDLYNELMNTLSGKKGNFRSLFSGRLNMSGRAVITLDTSLRIDQVRLPYRSLLVLLEQTIINILHKSYNITYAEAYKTWLYGTIQDKPNPNLVSIIESIINNNKEGLPILINRNPTINYGSILQMFCIGINYDYVMSLSYGILNGLAADFDGDCLNILYIINKEFFEMANLTLNPRNSMYLSKNDGYLSSSVLPMKDTLVNANTMINLCRDNYSPEQLAKIERIRHGNR